MSQLTWNKVIGKEKQQPYFQKIFNFIYQQQALGKVIYPPLQQIFTAFQLTEFHQVKVVILGQDPYHAPNQAHGLCFSVLPKASIPPSLVNIYRELQRDIVGFHVPGHGYLASWATQGVLMLNTVLTVEAGHAHSHAGCGWEIFTDSVINALNKNNKHLVFMLWGSFAQKKGQYINNQNHLILQSSHPSPLSAYRGFLGCGHFSTANYWLQDHGMQPINWHSISQVNLL